MREFEIVVGPTIDPENCITAIVCRNCESRNDSLVKKILETRELFYSSESKLVAERGFVKSTKKQNKEDDQRGKRRARALFDTETTDMVSSTNQPDIPLVLATIAEKSRNKVAKKSSQEDLVNGTVCVSVFELLGLRSHS